MKILSQPPIAFLIYIALVSILSAVGRVLAGPDHPNAVKSSAYASGEKEALSSVTVPGYRPFFRVALFFAILHLGVIVLGSSGLTPMAGVYLLGLMLALIALILG
jgi:NADH:ubiquinone oxidoreductase subunit 3 (subunit A)